MASSADARPAVIFFDCDDCLYKNDWKVANLLTAKIESFCSERLQMREGYAYELYKKWGTCLRGMQQEGILDDAMVEEYLEYSHDVPLHEHIGPDPELRRMLESLDPSIPRWVFTASTVPHATRCPRAPRRRGPLPRRHRRARRRVGHETRPRRVQTRHGHRGGGRRGPLAVSLPRR